MSKCKSCGAPLVWIKTLAGKNMPCNAEPVRFDYKLGSEDKVVTENGEVLPAEIRSDGSETGYIPHWATCPEADKHRKRGPRIYWHTKGKYHIPAFGNVSLLHQAGYDGLAAAIVQLAIKDIRACSLRDIERYEDPAYMAKGAATAKCRRYLSAKSFLLSRRFTMFCEWSGKDIYNYLIEEKKQKEAKPND